MHLRAIRVAIADISVENRMGLGRIRDDLVLVCTVQLCCLAVGPFPLDSVLAFIYFLSQNVLKKTVLRRWAAVGWMIEIT